MDQKISVIIPIYNVEAYLADCIHSVLQQTYSCTEVILVDDGSPDRCGEICDCFAKEDDRVKVIHKPNGGVSSARNAGLDAAEGDFIFFIDPDDYMHSQTLEQLYDLQKEYDADIALCYSRGTFLRDYREPDAAPYMVRCLSGFEAMQKLYMEDTFDFFGYNPTTVLHRLYRKKIFEDGLRFNEAARLAEDLTITPYILDRAERIVSTDRRMYYIYKNRTSLTRSSFSVEKWRNLSEAVNDMYLDRIAYFKRQPKYAALLQKTYEIALFDLAESWNKCNDSTAKKRFRKTYNAVFADGFRSGKLRGKRMLILLLLRINIRLFNTITGVKKA